MTVPNDHSATQGIFVALLTLCLTGCQQWRAPTMPWNESKVTAARKTNVLSNGDSSGDVTKEQKADVQMAIARSAENQGQTEQAIKAYQEAVAKDSSRTDAYHRLAVLYDKKGDRENAEKYFSKALQKTPKNAELLADFGYSCYLHRRWADAERNLRRAIEIDPQLGRAHNNLGLVLARNGQADQAIVEFAKAGCSEAEAHANLGYAMSMSDNWKHAQREFELALRLDPHCRTAQKGMDLLQHRGAQSSTALVATRDEVKRNGPVQQTAFYGNPPQPSPGAEVPREFTPWQPPAERTRGESMSPPAP